MRRRFFVESFSDAAAILRGQAADHLGRVLRAEPGQLYELSDGHCVWLAKVQRVALSKRDDNCIEFALLEPIAVSESPLQLNLLISIVKFDRFEWCIEKATELGAHEIVPLAAARTDKPLIVAAAKRHERWNRILLESAQQSRRLRPPLLSAVKTPPDAFAQSSDGLKLLLSERRTAANLRELLPQSRAILSEGSAPAPAALAIGPEGGWTDPEIAAAIASGFAEASLGQNILRTETAVIASMSILAFALQPARTSLE
jgi:16S rRNA (uracil1498-N3)-methyltransferase